MLGARLLWLVNRKDELVSATEDDRQLYRVITPLKLYSLRGARSINIESGTLVTGIPGNSPHYVINVMLASPSAEQEQALHTCLPIDADDLYMLSPLEILAMQL